MDPSVCDNKRFKQYSILCWLKPLRQRGILSLFVILAAFTACAHASTTTGYDYFYTSSQTNFSMNQKIISDRLISQNNNLIGIGEEIVKSSFSSTIPAASGHIQSLPAVPTAILMVSIGFVCISLVRDHKAWATALIGLLLVTQAGIDAVPQLAKHICLRAYNHDSKHLGYAKLYQIKITGRLRCEVEGSKYIGLLNYLSGIPIAKICYHQRSKSGQFRNDQLPPLNLQYIAKNSSASTEHKNSHPVITFDCCTSLSFDFITASLSRGPPGIILLDI